MITCIRARTGFSRARGTMIASTFCSERHDFLGQSIVRPVPFSTNGVCVSYNRKASVPRQAISIYLGGGRWRCCRCPAPPRERTLSEMARVKPSDAERRPRGNVARAERLSSDFPLSLFLSFFLSPFSHAARRLAPRELGASTARPHARRARQGVSRCRYLRLTGERKEIRLPGRRITRPSARETRHGAYRTEG